MMKKLIGTIHRPDNKWTALKERSTGTRLLEKEKRLMRKIQCFYGQLKNYIIIKLTQ